MQSFDFYSIRQDFPVLSRSNRGKPLVYLDNAATSQKPQCVIDAVAHYYTSTNSNVHRGVYELAEQAEVLYQNARDSVAEWLNVSCDEIIFTRGATESLNLIAQSYARPFFNEGDIIVLTEMEHHANIVPWQMIAEQTGAIIEVVPILDDGSVDREKLSELLGLPSTKLLSLCHVSNVLGTVNPVKEIVKEAHGNGVKVVIDGAQSVPHLKVDLQDLDCDFFVFSGHKLFAPMGIGIAFAKKEYLNDMVPYQGGGDMIDQVTFSKTTYAKGVQRFEASNR